MEKIELLIVEDDEKVINDIYIRNINSFNLDASVKINYTISKTKDEAIEILNNLHNFDAAIVDLDLLGLHGNDKSGNEVIRIIKNNLRFPVFVISGTPHNLDIDLRNESSLFKIKSRGEEGDYIDEIVSIYNTGITKILKRKGTIDEYLNTIFWNHLSNSMGIWIEDDSRSPEEKQKTLLRYTLLHIQEYLELSEDSDFEDYHPAEIYITPPVKPNIFTGDVIKEKKTEINYIVLTPSCDLAHEGKTEIVLLVQIQNKNEGEINRLKTIIINPEESNGNKKSAEKELKRLINNSQSSKFHFLPDYENIEAGLINFQQLKSVPKKSILEDYDRIASVNSTFTKDIVARFSYYYSRQGSPDFNENEIYNSLIS